MNTSYVTVEPKKKKQTSQQEELEETGTEGTPELASVRHPDPSLPPLSASFGASLPQRHEEGRVASALPPSRQPGPRASTPGGRELRRARIVITVKRTESYKRWLEENPLQAIIAGDTDDPDDVDPDETSSAGKKAI